MYNLSFKLMLIASKISTMVGINLFAADAKSVSDKFNELLKQMWTPLIAIAGTLAAVWGVYLGWKFWAAGGDENKKRDARSALLNFFIGIFVIFAVAALTPLIIAWLTTWQTGN